MPFLGMVVIMILIAMVLIAMVLIAMVLIAMVLIGMLRMGSPFGCIVIVLVEMNLAVEMFGLTPYRCWTDSGFDAETAVVGKSPLEHCAEEAIDRIVGRFALGSEVVLETSVTFKGDHRSHPGLPFAQLFF